MAKCVFQPDTNILIARVFVYNSFYCPCASVKNERQCHISNICPSKNKKVYAKSSREMLSSEQPLPKVLHKTYESALMQSISQLSVVRFDNVVHWHVFIHQKKLSLSLFVLFLMGL